MIRIRRFEQKALQILQRGEDRRLPPSLHRPGKRGRRHLLADGRQRSRHHRLSRPRPRARRRHEHERVHGRALRQGHRLLEGQGRLDALLRAGQELLGRPRHRRRPDPARPRPRLRHEIQGPQGRRAVLPGRRRGQPGLLLRVLQHGRALRSAGHLRHREQRLLDGHEPGALLRLQDCLAAARRGFCMSSGRRRTAKTSTKCAPTTQTAIERAHKESKPTILEIDTYRYYGHSVADAKHKGGYRTDGGDRELQDRARSDPAFQARAHRRRASSPRSSSRRSTKKSKAEAEASVAIRRGEPATRPTTTSSRTSISRSIARPKPAARANISSTTS